MVPKDRRIRMWHVHDRGRGPTLAFLAASACSLGLFAQPEDSRSAGRPPEGFARPPFHLKLDDAGKPSGGKPLPAGLSPAAARHFYGFDLIANLGAAQIIGIVPAYDDPNIESDLGVFNTTYQLATCTTKNGGFKKIYASGGKPSGNSTWALEASLDVEWSHALAPQAKIYLVEAASNSLTDLFTALDAAVKNEASVVSMSFGGSEFMGETNYDFHFTAPNVTFVAASGDNASGVEYPSASSYVLAVGGTTANLGANNSYASETASSLSGGRHTAAEQITRHES